MHEPSVDDAAALAVVSKQVLLHIIATLIDKDVINEDDFKAKIEELSEDYANSDKKFDRYVSSHMSKFVEAIYSHK